MSASISHSAGSWFLEVNNRLAVIFFFFLSLQYTTVKILSLNSPLLALDCRSFCFQLYHFTAITTVSSLPEPATIRPVSPTPTCYATVYPILLFSPPLLLLRPFLDCCSPYFHFFSGERPSSRPTPAHAQH